MTTTTAITSTNSPKIVFWGTDNFVIPVLDALLGAGLTPERIVTTGDRPKGRKQIMTPPPVKVWAEAHQIPVDQPEKLKEYALPGNWDLFIVASYGKIIPQRILDLARRGTLNVHPSLLPRFRGPSPVPSSVLAGEKHTGVSIMLLDAEMDHGPILAQAPYTLSSRDTSVSLFTKLFTLGGTMLTEIIPTWLSGDIVPREQDHTAATYTRKFSGEDGLLDFKTLTPGEIDRRVRALNPEPGTFFYMEDKGKQIRVKLLETDLIDGKLALKSVQPEGKTPMSGENFRKRYPSADFWLLP